MLVFVFEIDLQCSTIIWAQLNSLATLGWLWIFFTVWFRQGLEELVSGIGAMDSRLHRIFAGGNSSGGAHSDSPLVDSSEQVYISSLALLKMLKHDMVEF